MMALLKYNGYDNRLWEFDLGDPSIKSELGEQLVVSNGELVTAINMEGATDKLFARILQNRSKAHNELLEKLPYAK